jgi:hypothetical protein
MNKEISKDLAFEIQKKDLAKNTNFKLKSYKRKLLTDYYVSKNGTEDHYEGHEKNPLQGAKTNLLFVNLELAPMIRSYFKLSGKKFELGYSSLSLGGSKAIAYYPVFDGLGYEFAPDRKPALLTENILERLFNANINQKAVETFGELSKIQIINEMINAITKPKMKAVKDTLHRIPKVG